MAAIEIGLGKSGRRSYGLDELLLLPQRRTRAGYQVDLSCQIDANKLELPFLASAMDSVTSPAMAAAIGKIGGLAVLDLEGIWTTDTRNAAFPHHVTTVRVPHECRVYVFQL